MSKKVIIILSLVLILTIFLVKKSNANNIKNNEALPEGEPVNENQMDIPASGIPGTKHFNISEFHCHDGTKVPAEFYGNVQALMNNLEIIREALGGKPVKINSGYRTPSYNTKVGGAKNSQHMYGRAADIVVSGYTPAQVYAKILELIAAGKIHDGGRHKYPTFVHYDVGPSRTWK